MTNKSPSAVTCFVLVVVGSVLAGAFLEREFPRIVVKQDE